MLIRKTGTIEHEAEMTSPKLMRQSSATAPKATPWPRRALLRFHFAPDICNIPSPLFTGPPPMMRLRDAGVSGKSPGWRTLTGELAVSLPRSGLRFWTRLPGGCLFRRLFRNQLVHAPVCHDRIG
jgi:hypothetical protein